MSNQELIDARKRRMDETDQAIERSKLAVEQTIEVGAQTGVALKSQTEQMGRIVNDLDTIQFYIKKISQLVKEIRRRVATYKCIMFFLYLVVCGVIAIIIVKVQTPSLTLQEGISYFVFITSEGKLLEINYSIPLALLSLPQGYYCEKVMSADIYSTN